MTSPIKPEYEKYDSPMALAKDPDLSKSRKEELLKKWYEDEEALARATAEGLGGGEDNHLKNVAEALDLLGLKPPLA